MAFPTVPTIDYSYTAFQQAQGKNEFPGTQLDNDLAKLADGVAGVRAFLEGSFRSDGVLLPGALPAGTDLDSYGKDLEDIRDEAVAARDEAVAAAASAEAAVTGKADAATTLAGYGITDAAPLSHVGAGGAAHALATTSAHGFMASTDKSKLDGVGAGANVSSVAGKTGAVTLAKADVGLGNVDNTSDADKPVSTATAAALSGKASASHVGAGGAEHAVATTASAGFMSSTDKRKANSVVSVTDYGAVGDGVTDDTTAFVAAATASSAIFVPFGSWVVNLTTSNAGVVFAALKNLRLDGDLTINLASGVYARSASIDLSVTGSKRVTLAGAAPVVATISAGTPSVTANVVTGNRYRYDVTIPVVSSAGISTGDWVVVKTTGVNLTYTSYDHTVNGARHNELDGFWEVVGTTSTSITVRNRSRQSPANFPGAGTIAAATADVTGGTISKLPTVLTFAGCHGFNAYGDFGTLTNIAIVGNDAGSASGVNVVAKNTSAINYSRSIGLYNVGVANFTISGVNCDGAGAVVTGDRVFSSGHGQNAFRINGAKATLQNSIASGSGNTAGNGFFVSGGGELNCSYSIANGVRNTGFIANRVSTMVAEGCVSINNGNYADEVAGGWADAEGKGYESEVGSRLYAGSSVALFMTELGFYSLGGSMLSCMYAVSAGHIHAHGFYAIQSSKIQARYAVANGNGAYGFYPTGDSSIDAMNTRSQSNAVADYHAIGASQIWAKSYLGSPVFAIPNDVSGSSQIITTDSGSGTKLVLAKGAGLTIASDAVTVTHSYHIIDTEAAAATDNLSTISGGTDGMVLVLRTATSARDVTVKHNVGNILLNGATDRVLDNLADKIVLFYDGVASKWYELSFANNT